MIYLNILAHDMRNLLSSLLDLKIDATKFKVKCQTLSARKSATKSATKYTQ